MVLKVGSTNYSGNCIQGGYDVSLEDIYNEWEDGFHVKHRDMIRRKAVGTIEMHFASDSEYNAFLTDLENARTGAEYSLEVACNNSANTVIGSFFVKLRPIRTRNASSHDVMDDFTLEIEEA